MRFTTLLLLVASVGLAAEPPLSTLRPGQSVQADGHTLTLTGLTWEVIEPAPESDAYPAGSGVTVSLAWDGEDIHLTRLSAGYTSVEHHWLPDHHLALGPRIEDDGVDLVVERLQVGLVRDVTVQRGERVDLGGELSMRFEGHSHKMVEAGESPLMVNVSFLAGDQLLEERTFSLDLPSDRTFGWRHALFTLNAHNYGERMDLRVQLRDGVPVSFD